MTHEDYKGLLAASALEALDADDARALRMHLEECADCSSESIEWEETAALLALSASPREPSSTTRERILASVRAEGVSRVSRAADQTSRPRAGSAGSEVLPFEGQRRNVWTSLGSFGAIAAAITLVGLSISLLMLWRQNRSLQAEVIRMQTEMRHANETLANARAFREMLTSPDARMASLAGTSVAPGARAMLAYDKTGHAMLMARGLPAAPAGKAYQLWFIMDNKKMPGKVFTTDAEGNGNLRDEIPAAAIGSAIFAITLEPADGVQAPTGAVYLLSAS
jgi:anti-sigma-K factor RskA